VSLWCPDAGDGNLPAPRLAHGENRANRAALIVRDRARMRQNIVDLTPVQTRRRRSPRPSGTRVDRFGGAGPQV
jgi:hypothetical protein